jgi:hypothetical protein
MMNVIYNSDHYSVLSYPAQQGFELVDKDAMKMLFLQGPYAQCFDQAIRAIPEEERTMEGIDDFLGDYCADWATPIRFQ